HDILRMGEVLVLQHRAEGGADVQAADPFHRGVQLIKQLLCDLGRELTGVAAPLDLLGDDDDVVGLGDGLHDG
ncbi:50S ribosomal protein L29, partial [Dysosmobacter welbionis]